MHVSIKEAKDRLSELVRIMEAGERVIITRRGEEIAELARPNKRKGGANLEALRKWKAEHGIGPVFGPMSPDFDDELPEDFLIAPFSGE